MRMIAFLALLLAGIAPLTAQVKSGKPQVEVVGGVRMPQKLDWSPDLTLMAAIGNCSGTGWADKRIRLVREGKTIGTYNLRDIQKDSSKDPKLLPGDLVIVPG